MRLAFSIENSTKQFDSARVDALLQINHAGLEVVALRAMHDGNRA